MRIVAALTGWLLLPILAACECPVRPPLNLQTTFSGVRVEALFQGLPAQSARVDVIDWAGEPRRFYSALTDANGVATLPKLAAGSYLVEVWTGTASMPDLIIDSQIEVQNGSGSYPMNLRLSGFAERTPSQIARARTEHRAEVLHEFSGDVRDRSGAGVPGASVDVWRVEPQTHRFVGEAVSDNDGGFFLSLRPGNYVATFRAAGFFSEGISFEVTKDNRPAGVRSSVDIVLDVASC